MQLSLAALFITQNVPVLSKDPSSRGRKNEAGDHSLTPHHRLRITADSMQKATISENDSKRILINKRITEQQLGFGSGVLKNIPSSTSSSEADEQLCDPRTLTGDDADIGILSCGTDQWCQPSTGSFLGGVCSSRMPPSADSQQQASMASRIAHLHARREHPFTWRSTRPRSRRSLLHVNDALETCDPTSEYFDDACDCTGVDRSSGTGTMVCLETATVDVTMFGCGEYVQSRSYVYAFERHLLKEIKICEEIKGDYERTSCAISHSADDCTFTFNDQTCSSCAVTESFFDFDCRNVVGGMAGHAVEDLYTVINQCEARYEGTSTCANLCGAGWEIPEGALDLNVTLSGYGSVSCGYLWLLEEMKSIPEPYCTDFSVAAKSGCCFPKPDEARESSKADFWEDKTPGAGGSPIQVSWTVNALCGLAFLGSFA